MNTSQYGSPGNRPLTDIDNELGPEWAAALYESYTADNEAWDDTYTRSPLRDSSHTYALTAMDLAERIEREVYARQTCDQYPTLCNTQPGGCEYHA